MKPRSNPLADNRRIVLGNAAPRAGGKLRGLAAPAGLLVALLLLALTATSRAGDWPLWRYDAGRTAATPHALPETLVLRWSVQLQERQPVWDDPLNHDLMPYDRIFEPIVMGQRLIVAFNDSDKIQAYDLAEGKVLWSFYAEGPIRLPPAGWDDKVCVASDDGWLYCLRVADGALVWKFRGAPAETRVLGNRRLISAWPARGGPVVRDGVVYFAASIWPFMGTFLYALDAETGGILWLNDSSGSQYHQQPHSAPAFAGVAPQGALVLDGDTLLVPGGRSIPAAFDARTGTLRHFLLNAGGKGNGGSFVIARDGHFYVHTRHRGVRRFDLSSGNKTEVMLNEPVLVEGGLYTATAESVMAYDLDKQLLWQVAADGSGDLIRAGDRLYAAGQDAIRAIALPRDDAPAELAWTLPVQGEVLRLLAGGDRLVAVTRGGAIHIFGPPEAVAAPPAGGAQALAVSEPVSETARATARTILAAAGADAGYALCLGADSAELCEALAENAPLQITLLDPDPVRVDALRRRWDAAGIYGRPLVAQVGHPETLEMPPYVARLIVVDRALAPHVERPATLARLHRSLRPYGGTLCLPRDAADEQLIASQLRSLEPETARVHADAGMFYAVREGALPGAAPWTHQYGDIANTVKSDDQRVRAPLGMLWFGGNSHLDILPRHGHGPTPQVLGGRLFLQGMNSVSARDVYTGRVLWRREFGDLGTAEIYYDETYRDTPLDTAYNQVHIPGANLRGTNYVVTPEGVYLVVGKSCQLLDPASGETLRVIELPPAADGRAYDEWAYLGVHEDLLLAGAGFANYSRRLDGVRYEPTGKRGMAWSPDRFGSLGLMALDRQTGAVKWQIEARHSFLHNGIVAGNGRIYCLDKLPKSVEDQLARRGRSAPDTYRLLALDSARGQLLWEVEGQSFGTWLGYSEEHDLLLQAGASASDRSMDEVGQGMAVYRASDGSTLWKHEDLAYAGPCILHGDTIITNAASYRVNAGAFRLLDGQPATRPNPVTGRDESWHFVRSYGCNTAVACENLITFRSGAAGYYDLTQTSGTANIGGFRAGCTSNLIAADGVLSAPDFTRTCSCGYQNQTSLALVPMPEVEAWSVVRPDQFSSEEPLRRIGVNFGAPGDRQSSSGTLWLEFPLAGGDAPPLEIALEGSDLAPFQRHSAFVSGDSPRWVFASGVQNVRHVTLRLRGAAATTPAKYMVRLYFSEPGDVLEGGRVFQVALQGNPVAEALDVRSRAGGVLRGTVLECRDVLVESLLQVDLTPQAGSAYGPVLSGLECIEQPPDPEGAAGPLD